MALKETLPPPGRTQPWGFGHRMSLQLPLLASNYRLVILHEEKCLHILPKTLNYTFPFRTDEVRTCKIDLECTFVEPMKLTQSQIHGPSICTGPWNWGALPVLGLMLCCNCHEILDNFIFDFVICKWNQMGQWSEHVSRRDTQDMRVHHSLAPHLQTAFSMSHEHRSPVGPQCQGVQQHARLVQRKCLHWWSSQWEHWEAFFSLEP